MVLIKNVVIKSKRNRYLKAQQYSIFTNVIDEATQAHLFKLHNKFSIVRPTFKEVCFFLLIFFKNILNVFFKVKEKKFNGGKCSFIRHLYFKHNEILR
jgi:hypothetical protein